MAIASWMLRGRSSRGGRSIRSPQDAEDVQIDFSKDSSEVCRQILHNLCKKQTHTEGKIFAYLSSFLKLVSKVSSPQDLGYSVEQLLCCLRIPLVHEASHVRAAALQAVRYIVKEEKDVRALYGLHYPYLITRCFDINLRNDMERVQALRLARRLLTLTPSLFPATVVRSLVSLANGAVEERDQMLRACLATLAEICVLNPELFIECGGVTAISRNLLTCQLPRVSEALCGILLFLLNKPNTRRRASIFLAALAAPYCDFHVSCGKVTNNSPKNDRESQFISSRLALLSVLRSWPGILHFCHPHNISGLRAIVDILHLKQQEVRKAVLDLLYDLLGLPQPEWTDELNVAFEAIDPSRPRTAWKLSEGFVAAEGKALLPHLSKFRPNLTEIHMALLVYIFVEIGLLEAIVEVIVTSDLFISIRAIILLGELLRRVHILLPPECCDLTPALPNLFAHAANTSDKLCQQRALAAVAALNRLHGLLSRRPAPASLFLNQLQQTAKKTARSAQTTFKDSDDVFRETAVLSNKDGFSWNWTVVRALLKCRPVALKKLEDSVCRNFLRRLVHYFKPSSNRFSRVESGNRQQTNIYTLAGCELIDCLLETDEPEGVKLLSELLADIWQQIDCITSAKTAHECLFSPQNMMNSLCQYYFLFIGRMSRTAKGLQCLEKAGIMQQLLNLVTNTNHECYIKLVVSSLDYSLGGMPRIILNKVLTSTCESLRLYATQLMTVLLRTQVPDFSKWGLEMLVMQLYDTSKSVSCAAVSVLMEACEEKIYLDALISLHPSLLHLGDRGQLLFVRLMSTPAGFNRFQEGNAVSRQLQQWVKSYNYRYVGLVEGELHDSLTLHQRGEDGRYIRRISSIKQCVHDVFVPPHLYGQLAQHQNGLQLLLHDGNLHNYFQIVQAQNCSSDQAILEMKAALWLCGHVATSAAGLAVVLEDAVVQAIVKVAETCEVYSVRGTAFYVLGLVATTFNGAKELKKSGWLSVRHNRHELWPVIEDEICDPSLDTEIDSISTTSISVDTDCHTHFYIEDEDSDREEHLSLEVPSFNERSGGCTNRIITPKTACQQKSLTLPHRRQPRHVRSLSESKQSSGWEQAEIGDHVQKLSPIPSSTSLNTLKSSTQQRRSSRISYWKHSTQGSVSSEGVASSPETTSSKLSHQDLQGYATLRSIHRFRLPLYPDSKALSPEELMNFGDVSGITLLSLTAKTKGKGLGPQFSQASLCEFEASAPARAFGGQSSASLPSREIDESRSSFGRQPGALKDHDEIHQCYMGITLPEQLDVLFPADDYSLQAAAEAACHKGSVSFSEMEEVLETEETAQTSSSESEDLDSPSKVQSESASQCYQHHTSDACLVCCRRRDRKVSSSSCHRQRTDTESSCGGADSPIFLSRNGKLRNPALLAITPGGSVESSTYLEIAAVQNQDDDIVLSKSFVRKEILKHVGRMSNPVWTKISKQALLQLKQKYPGSFQDTCLYSEVSHRLGSSTYRLIARRFIQELFLDLTFDALYEEPTAILSSPVLPIHLDDNPRSRNLDVTTFHSTDVIIPSTLTPTVCVSEPVSGDSNINAGEVHHPSCLLPKVIMPKEHANYNCLSVQNSLFQSVKSDTLCKTGLKTALHSTLKSDFCFKKNYMQLPETKKIDSITLPKSSDIHFCPYTLDRKSQQSGEVLYQDRMDIPMIDEAVNIKCISPLGGFNFSPLPQCENENDMVLHDGKMQSSTDFNLHSDDRNSTNTQDDDTVDSENSVGTSSEHLSLSGTEGNPQFHVLEINSSRSADFYNTSNVSGNVKRKGVVTENINSVSRSNSISSSSSCRNNCSNQQKGDPENDCHWLELNNDGNNTHECSSHSFDGTFLVSSSSFIPPDTIIKDSFAYIDPTDSQSSSTYKTNQTAASSSSLGASFVSFDRTVCGLDFKKSAVVKQKTVSTRQRKIATTSPPNLSAADLNLAHLHL